MNSRRDGRVLHLNGIGKRSFLLLAALVSYFAHVEALASFNPNTAPVLQNKNQKLRPLHEAELQRLFPEAEHPHIGPLAEISGQLYEKLTAAKKALTSYKTLTRVLPLIEWLPAYLRSQWKKSLYKDISAGIVVGIMLVPQAIAYSLLASVPPQYG